MKPRERANQGSKLPSIFQYFGLSCCQNTLRPRAQIAAAPKLPRHRKGVAMTTELTMPQMGYDMQEGVIVRWLKAEGDFVRAGEPIAEIETDKAVVEFEAYTRRRTAKDTGVRRLQRARRPAHRHHRPASRRARAGNPRHRRDERALRAGRRSRARTRTRPRPHHRLRRHRPRSAAPRSSSAPPPWPDASPTSAA